MVVPPTLQAGVVGVDGRPDGFVEVVAPPAIAAEADVALGQQVDVQRPRSPHDIASAPVPLLDGMAYLEQLVRDQPRVDARHDVQIWPLIRPTHRIGLVDRGHVRDVQTSFLELSDSLLQVVQQLLTSLIDMVKRIKEQITSKV